MTLVESFAAVLLDAGAAALLGWTTWSAIRSREKPSAIPFAATLAALTLWAIFAMVSEFPGASSAGTVSLLWDLGQFGSALIIPAIWTIYALSYTGRGTGLTTRRVVMLAGVALPVLLAAVVIAVGPPQSLVERMLAGILGTEFLYVFGLFVYATYLLIGLGRQHARVSLFQTTILTFGVGAPYLVAMTTSTGPPADGVTIGFLVGGGLLAGAVRRYPVMTGFPKADYVARTRVVEALQEAVVVLDWDDYVLDANATTAELFDPGSEGMIGKPIQSVVGDLGGTDLSAGSTGTLTLQTTQGRRRFQFSVSAVDSDYADSERGTGPVARTVLFRDVTDRQTREQRLTVLNRVLRHNLRNKLDVVLAYTDRIENDDIQSEIQENANDLVTLSNKAREAEAVMQAFTAQPEPVDLTDIAADVADQYRSENPTSDIAVDCPHELVVSSHRTVLEHVLSELVDNALEHSDKSSPQVEIRVTEDPEAKARLTVADNGPGIPQRERQLLADETETQLEHGRGIGLWFVNWAVTQLGGDLSFDDNDGEGSTVTVRLYGSQYESSV
ncbi:MAG: signal transduction histidine kinase [Halobacteriales archaeon]|jgi:signal transduction histidine kinase